MEDKVRGLVVPFTVTLYKGYISIIAAWRKGSQFVFQPDFARSDRKFKGHDTLSSAAIATYRGSNERVVRLSKMSGFLKRRNSTNSDLSRLNNGWLA